MFSFQNLNKKKLKKRTSNGDFVGKKVDLKKNNNGKQMLLVWEQRQPRVLVVDGPVRVVVGVVGLPGRVGEEDRTERRLPRRVGAAGTDW